MITSMALHAKSYINGKGNLSDRRVEFCKGIAIAHCIFPSVSHTLLGIHTTCYIFLKRFIFQLF